MDAPSAIEGGGVALALACIAVLSWTVRTIITAMTNHLSHLNSALTESTKIQERTAAYLDRIAYTIDHIERIIERGK